MSPEITFNPAAHFSPNESLVLLALWEYAHERGLMEQEIDLNDIGFSDGLTNKEISLAMQKLDYKGAFDCYDYEEGTVVLSVDILEFFIPSPLN